MKSYQRLLKLVSSGGVERRNERTGVGTFALFGEQLRIPLRHGFPLLTTKKLPFRFIVHEMLWFLSGDSRIDYLHKHKVTIWDEWATKEQCERFGREEGDLGPIYGPQWRRWKAPNGREIDQIANLMELIKRDPESRRLLVTAWNPADVDKVALPPCHAFFQCFVAEGKLSLHLYQRSADIFLGVPFNIASYALLVHMIAHVAGLEVDEFIHTFGDLHLYSNHVEQAATQLVRVPRELPKLSFRRRVNSIFDFTYEDVVLEGYDPHEKISAPVAV